MPTSLVSLFYVTGEFHRFLHRGRAKSFQKTRIFTKKSRANLNQLFNFVLNEDYK